MRTDAFHLNRGEPFLAPFTMSVDGHDFTGCVVVAQVRASVDTAVLATPTIDVSSSGVGFLTGTVTMTSQQTAALPARCTLAMQVSRSAPAWGPHSVPVITLNVETPWVR